MPKYLEIAAEANLMAKDLLAIVPEQDKPKAAEMIARLVNFGVRCSPRGVQSTVRFNFVQRTTRDLPVKVGMQKVTGRNGGTFNALSTTPIYPNATEGPATVDGVEDEE